MEYREILVDTSVLIDFFRKKNRKRSFLYKLGKKNKLYASSITEFEFLAGLQEERMNSLQNLFENINIIAFDTYAAVRASSIYKTLRANNSLIDFRDILIGATALVHELPIATLNTKHFERINGLEIIEDI